MTLPEGHVENVCLRGGVMCPHLLRTLHLGSGVTDSSCMKLHGGGGRLFKAIFADMPDVLEKALEDEPKGNCSGPPAYIEYT